MGEQLALDAVDRDAHFSDCGTYRWRLWRIWDARQPIANFVMLNPSTADEHVDDPTVRRCLGFARREDCGGLVVTNLFALRATDPRALYTHADPIGEKCDVFLRREARGAGVVVAAWGVHGALRQRGDAVRRFLEKHGVELHVLGLTKAGHPRHPLYLRGDTPLERWR